MDHKNDALPYYGSWSSYLTDQMAAEFDRQILNEAYRKTIDIEGEVVQNVKQLPETTESNRTSTSARPVDARNV